LLVLVGHVRYLFITILAKSEYTLAVKFDLESVKCVLAETDLNSGNLFILRLPNLSVSLLSSPSWNRCLFVIKSELNSVLVESESELCTRGNNTSHISFNYLYTTTLSGKSVYGDVLTWIPLFIESIFEVPLKKQKKKEKRRQKKEKKDQC
jgi:hypothetical protein